MLVYSPGCGLVVGREIVMGLMHTHPSICAFNKGPTSKFIQKQQFVQRQQFIQKQQFVQRQQFIQNQQLSKGSNMSKSNKVASSCAEKVI